MFNTNHFQYHLAAFVFAVSLFATPPYAAADPLKVYLLTGQSNMDGKVWIWDNFATVDTWNIPSLDYMTNNQAYYDTLPESVFSFKEAYSSDWMTAPRNDVWAAHYSSLNGFSYEVRSVQDTTPGDNTTPVHPIGIQPLSIGFGGNPSIGNSSAGTSLRAAQSGIELSLGHNLGQALQSPVMLFKSDRGGTNLAVDWRSPDAVTNRGGSTGINYINTATQFKNMLDGLDADLADDGVLNDYNHATSYEVAGFLWMQGWNDMGNATFRAEYEDNLVDLVTSVRKEDSRIPSDLPAVIIESADHHTELNAARIAAVAELNSVTPGSAVFVATDGLSNQNFGGLNASGGLFTNGFGSHFHNRPENYLEIGYRTGDAILASGFTGSEQVPEPTSLGLLTVGGLVLLRRKRSVSVNLNMLT